MKSFGGISAFTRALFFCFDKSLYSAVLAVSSFPKAFINSWALARISSSLMPLAASSIFMMFITCTEEKRKLLHYYYLPQFCQTYCSLGPIDSANEVNLKGRNDSLALFCFYMSLFYFALWNSVWVSKSVNFYKNRRNKILPSKVLLIRIEASHF